MPGVAILRGQRALDRGIDIGIVSLQSDAVTTAIDGFLNSLLQAVAIVVAVLLLFMGLRSGLIIGFILALTICGTFIFMGPWDIALERISLGALIIALGMLVDNAIVMVENIQWHMDQGLGRIKAAEVSVRELARPLGAATGTTLAVFVPMLIARGDSADFTRMIPVTIILMLAMSYLYALLVSPLLSEVLLVRRAEALGAFLVAFVEDAATPFDRRRHGMIVGMGAAALVVEPAD